MNLPEGRLLKVHHGGTHDVFHVVLPPTTGMNHQQHHIKYRYDTSEFFGQENCWHTAKNPCPAVKQRAGK